MRAVNLIPVEQRSGQPVGAGRSQGAAYAVLVLAGGIALMAFLYGQARHQVTSRRAQSASLTVKAQQAQAAVERLSPYTSFIAQREQRVQAVDALVDSRFDWAHALHEFGRVLPPQTSISTLAGTIGTAGASSGASAAGAAGSSTTGAVPSFTLAGCATSQSSVALTLERLRLIDGVKEVTLQSSSAGSAASSASAGGCSGRRATYSATVIFDPLPSSSAVAAANKTVADSTSAASPAPATTSSGAGAK
jgi:Tfp pilus assembly protein PilN